MKFPSIKNPSYPLNETYRDVAIRGEMENMTIVARNRVTRVPRIFGLTWTALSTADYRKLVAFYGKTNGAQPFEWTHPETGETVTVRFNGDMSFEYHEHGYWRGNLKLEEV